MAMLAEPRRRQRIGPNPRGKFYGEQDKNFGKSLLEKMGWTSGEGLGMERQGISEAIRPKIQMSSKGLGYDPKENPWVEHNREFEEILQGLKVEGVISPQIKTENEVELTADANERKLEKKSKKSRARIHYHKFVKGKDLSRATMEDMRSILGTAIDTSSRPESSTSTDKTSTNVEITSSMSSINGRIKQEINTGNEPNAEDDNGKNINRGSMVDYFKQKMEEKRLAAIGFQGIPIKQENEQFESKGDDAIDADGTLENNTKQKKRHKKEVRTQQTLLLDERNHEEDCSLNPKKEKKRKRKRFPKLDEDEELDEDHFRQEIQSKPKDELNGVATPTIAAVPEADDDNGKMINRGSMVDYFKQKMDQKRLAAITQVKLEVKNEQFEMEGVGAMNIENTLQCDVKSEKKSKRRKKEATKQALVLDDDNLDNDILNTKSEKKRKRKVAASNPEPEASAQDVKVEEIKANDEQPNHQSKYPKQCSEITTDEDEQGDNVEKRKKKKARKRTPAPSESPEEVTQSSAPVPIALTLEEQLKMEMENLKNGRQRLKKQYLASLGTVSKKFKGSNIDKVKGYTLY